MSSPVSATAALETTDTITAVALVAKF